MTACEREHQGMPWRERAQRAAVKVCVCRNRREEWQPGSPKRDGGTGGHLHTDFDAQGKFSGTRIQNTFFFLSAAFWQLLVPPVYSWAWADTPILPLPEATDIFHIPAHWEFVSCLKKHHPSEKLPILIWIIACDLMPTLNLC